MKEKEINTWKEDFGFNVSTKDDPDLLTYLFNNWIKNETTTPEARSLFKSLWLMLRSD